MRVYVTEDDYRIIQYALNCLYGSSCLISYPNYVNNNSPFGNTFSDSVTPRITEVDEVIRITESGKVRFKL